MGRGVFWHWAWGGAVACTLVACGRSDGSAPTSARAPFPEEVPSSLQVGGERVTAGFARGRLRLTQDVESFRLSRLITVSDYGACVDAGACSEPARITFSCDAQEGERWYANTWRLRDRAPNLPVVCVSPGDARRYCAWHGGELPSTRQWLLAARGAGAQNVPRFAWGDGQPTCERHPGPFTFNASTCCEDGCDPMSHLAVAQRPAGASPKGVLDVLMTPAELIGPSPDAQFPVCRSENGCLVTGGEPGAIDGFSPLRDAIEPDDPGYHEPPFGFRCAWKEGV